MSPPASDDDPFALFSLPRRFSIDEAALRAARVRLLARAHPDRAGSGAADVADAAHRSAVINAAYRSLASPIARAEALLRLSGTATSANEPLSPSFLMEMMELRESLDAALALHDQERVASMRRDAEARRAEFVAVIGSNLDAAQDAAPPDRPALLSVARDALGGLRYVERLLSRAAATDD